MFLGVRESWEYDSGARDLQSPDIHNQQLRHQSVHLKKRLEQPGTVLEQQAALHKLLAQTSASVAPLGGNYLELANTVSRLPISRYFKINYMTNRKPVYRPQNWSDVIYFFGLSEE